MVIKGLVGSSYCELREGKEVTYSGLTGAVLEMLMFYMWSDDLYNSNYIASYQTFVSK